MVTLLFLVGAAASSSFAGQKGDAAAGKKIYAQLCASCHGSAGKGDGPAAAALPVKPADHTDGKHMKALSDTDIFNIIKGGGSSVGKSALMPPWGGQLKDQDIQDVVAYIRTLGKPTK
jgi:mono/diheme cytochrome c family protein